MNNRNGELPTIAQARRYLDRVAILDADGPHTYAELLNASARIAAGLLGHASDLLEARIAFQIPPGLPWVATLWGIWLAGGIAVPLPLNATRPELEYFLTDTGAGRLLIPNADNAVNGVNWLTYADLLAAEVGELPIVDPARRAMILYTSGTTSRPKGVVTSHANIAAQIETLVHAWEWTQEDRIVLVLPLHHVHGIINVVSCALWSGASCEMLPRFDAELVWDRIAGDSLTLFMAVPTIFVRLIAAWEAASPDRRAELSAACAGLRLMVSGSAALPVGTLHRWREITGHTLLERYGMTEIGMALSNPYRGERIPGSVGLPLPGVAVQLVGEDGRPVPPGAPGEIEVKGPSVFLEYWGKPEATCEAFRQGWFRTGDTAILEDERYRILGRTSIDILKTGGHKVSALEIEEVLRTHPAILECAVVGVPDAEWGERIAAALVLRPETAPATELDLPSLRAWGRELLTAHKLPSRMLIVEALPRNAMGKVIKPEVTKLFEAEVANND